MLNKNIDVELGREIKQKNFINTMRIRNFYLNAGAQLLFLSKLLRDINTNDK